MIYRVTFGFTGPQGWTETHALLNAATSPQPLIPTVSDIAAKRAQMLGREFSINGIRISKYATDAGVRQRGSYLLKRTFKNSVQTVAASAEPSAVAYLVRGSAEPSAVNPQFDSNQNQTWLGGPLDICVNNAGDVDTAQGNLLACFQAWRSAMLGDTFGWLANETIATGNIVSITQNPNGTVKFTFDPADIAVLDVGTRYKCRAKQINLGVSPLNGELIVVPTSATEVSTVERIGLAVDQVGGSMRFYNPIQPFVDYGDLVLADTAAKHKRGRPFLSQPGRAKKRVRG